MARQSYFLIQGRDLDLTYMTKKKAATILTNLGFKMLILEDKITKKIHQEPETIEQWINNYVCYTYPEQIENIKNDPFLQKNLKILIYYAST
jgi:hypothetical protein